MAIIFAAFGSCLYVRMSNGSSLNETSCAISASVRTLKVPVLCMTSGMILISALSVPCVYKACLNGS
jgi:hypothetical protein